MGQFYSSEGLSHQDHLVYSNLQNCSGTNMELLSGIDSYNSGYRNMTHGLVQMQRLPEQYKGNRYDQDFVNYDDTQ